MCTHIINNVEVYGLEESIIASGYPMLTDIKNLDYEVSNLKYYIDLGIDRIIKQLKEKREIKMYDYYFSFNIDDKECLLCYEDYELALKNIYISSSGYLKCSDGFIHKLILSSDGLYTDHINKNKLDNRRNNLRLCQPQQNAFNSNISSNNTSGVVGVSYRKDRKKWEAYISPNNRQISLGSFDKFDDAVIARLNAEIEYFKEFSPQMYLFEQYGITNPYKHIYTNNHSAISAYNHIKRITKLGNSIAGSGHDNALNGIIVQFDLTFTLKAWTEMQRYHFVDFVSSQSTMHRITKFDIKNQCNKYVDDMIIDILKDKINTYNTWNDFTPTDDWLKNNSWNIETKEQYQNHLKDLYLDILYNVPSGFELTARMTTNYRALKTIYSQRKNHRLPEWREFCKWIEQLPYFKELCLNN